MTRTRLGASLMALGGVVLALSLLADPIGLGSNDSAFGWKQTVGVVVGAVVLAAGAVILYAGRRQNAGESPEATT